MAQAFHTALAENEIGRLSDDQIGAVTRMFRARRIVGWLLALLGAGMGAFELTAYFLQDAATRNEGGVLWETAAVFIVIALYGVIIVATSYAGQRRALNTPVMLLTGTPSKRDIAVPVRVPGPAGSSATHFMRVKTGVLKIEGEVYGVLPSTLYEEIVDGKHATFYWVPAGGVGFKKRLIVNYLD